MISRLFYRFCYESETREQNSITNENHTKDTYEACKNGENVVTQLDCTSQSDTDQESQVSTYSQESEVVNSKE